MGKRRYVGRTHVIVSDEADKADCELANSLLL